MLTIDRVGYASFLWKYYAIIWIRFYSAQVNFLFNHETRKLITRDLTEAVQKVLHWLQSSIPWRRRRAYRSQELNSNRWIYCVSFRWRMGRQEHELEMSAKCEKMRINLENVNLRYCSYSTNNKTKRKHKQKKLWLLSENEKINKIRNVWMWL